MDRVLEDIAAEAPEGDWVNNEGGRGTVSFFPTEEDEDARLVCDMIYGDEDDDEFDDGFDETAPPEDNEFLEPLSVLCLARKDVQ